jgi:hypothetical protein
VPVVLVPPARLERWVDNFVARHGPTSCAVVDGALRGDAADGSSFVARLPFAASYDGVPEVGGLPAAAVPPDVWGVLLVRKGGFAVARLEGERLVEHKIGQRHVQGRTKAGGQSQQRFARRRDNQARQAYEAAAGHAHRILVLESPPLRAVVCGGDHPAVEAVLEDPRLRHLGALRTAPWLPVPDPRRAVLDQAVTDGRSVLVRVGDPAA